MFGYNALSLYIYVAGDVIHESFYIIITLYYEH
jgi:hypothetical protein